MKGMVVEDWEYVDNGQVVWNICDIYMWYNGDDLIVEDVVIQFKIGKLMQIVYKGYGV